MIGHHTGLSLRDNESTMRLDLKASHCVVISLHSHLRPGEPSPEALASACGKLFQKRRISFTWPYSIKETSYTVAFSLKRSRRETIIDVRYSPSERSVLEEEKTVDLDKVLSCLESTSAHVWHCTVRFMYPPVGFACKYELPVGVDRPIMGFNEIRGIRLVNTVEGNVVYDVILDRPENTEIHLSVFFSLQDLKGAPLPKEALKRATEIASFLVQESVMPQQEKA
jgi:hypothetical protein